MALRLLHVLLPRDLSDDLDDVLRDVEVSDRWQGEVDGRVDVRLLVDADHTEDLLDDLKDRFEGTDGFRILLLDVEAAHPRGEDREEDRKEENHERQRGLWRSGRINSDELYESVHDSLRSWSTYLVLIGLSSIVAAAGFYLDSVAVIIGAMVIAPLLGPNVGLALATTFADPKLARRAGAMATAAVVLTVTVGAALGLVFPADPASREIAQRTVARLPDVALAVAAGAAGVIAFTTRLSAALVGVMVAVALMPALVATGLLVGSGNLDLAAGAFGLVLVNLVGINLAAVVTLWLQGLRPHQRWEEEEAERATLVAVVVWLALLALMAALIVLL